MDEDYATSLDMKHEYTDLYLRPTLLAGHALVHLDRSLYLRKVRECWLCTCSCLWHVRVWQPLRGAAHTRLHPKCSLCLCKVRKWCTSTLLQPAVI